MGGHTIAAVEKFTVLSAEEVLIRNTEHRMIHGPTTVVPLVGMDQKGQPISTDVEFTKSYDEHGKPMLTSRLPLASVGSIMLSTSMFDVFDE